MRKLLLLVLLAALVIVPVMAQEEGEPPRTGIRPDAPLYALHGPYWVGTMDMVIEGENPIDITIWYPALNPESLPEEVIYHFDAQDKLWFEVPPIETFHYGHALADAEPNMADGPYPFVIYSQGFGVDRDATFYLTEHLASHGFVVISANHTEVFDPEYTELGYSAIERPLDVQATIAFAEDLTAPEGDMAGLMDMDRMAAIGWSLGGYTALTAAGGRFDTAEFNARCEAAAPESKLVQVYCNNIVPHEEELAAMAGLETVPEAFWPDWGDDRIKAVVTLAGSGILQETGLSEINAPLMSIVGTIDGDGQGLIYSQEFYDYVSSEHKALVTLEGAAHQVFSGACDDTAGIVEMGFFGACSDPVWDMDRAHDLINHFTTAFLLAELYGDEEARAALAPDAVAFPGIGYEAVGY